MTLDLARRRSASRVAMATLLAGLCASVLTAILAASWLRDSLRHGCWPATADGRVEWLCSDGLGQTGPAIAIVASGAVALLAAATVVRRASARRPGPGASVVLALLAAAPTSAVCLLLLRDAVAQDAGSPVAPSRVDLWTEHALPAMLATAVACVVAAAGLGMRARGRAGRMAGALVLGSLALLLLGAGLTMAGALSTAIVAASIIGAGWWIVAVPRPVRSSAPMHRELAVPAER